jgi:hypothetical protein
MELFGKEIRFRGTLVRIAYLDGEGYQFLGDMEAAVAALRKSRPRADLFTFIQKISDTSPLHKYPMEMDNFAALPVSTFDHWMKRQMDTRGRGRVRKADKEGVVVREVPYDDDFVRGIQAIYNESPVRQGKPFWHYKKDIEDIRRMNGTFFDRSIFLGAYFQDELIGFVKLVFDEDKSQAGLMQILSMLQYRDKATTNALIAQAVRSCADRGIPYLWYCNFTYGKKPEDSLATFKRRCGFQKVEVPRYYVPLTLKGKLALRLGLHHSIKDLIPESVTATYHRARSFWYARKPRYQAS